MDAVMVIVEPVSSFGQCRCCLSTGYHKDLMKEYFPSGKREVYYEIMTECFNLFLSSNKNLTTLICSSCVRQLQSSYEFRNKVLSSEQELLAKVQNKETVFVHVHTEPLKSKKRNVKSEKGPTEPVKIEIQESSEEYDDNDNEETDPSYCEIELPSKAPKTLSLDDEELIPGAMELITKYAGQMTTLPRRNMLSAIYPEFARNLKFFEDEIVTSKTMESQIKAAEMLKRANDTALCEKYAVINNASHIVECSNVIPFRSQNRNGFPCFYCRHPFDNLKEIIEHQNKNHKRNEFRSVLATYGSESMIVYVDVTDLHCTLCKQKMPNIIEFKNHLVKVHKKYMYTECTDRVIPFKLSNDNVFECQTCGFSFETFGSIERHMNTHYRNYVCKDCGVGFITRYRLKIHQKSMHVAGSFPCEHCKKEFSSQQKLKSHVETVHEAKKRFKCRKCPVRFTEYFQRQKHMEMVHGVAPLEYKCNVCDRSFNRRYTLSRHMKRDHLEERDFQCEVCSYKCFTNNELRVHMVKHNGERIFECSVCKKSYARKKTLREHMRIHNNDRRFVCAVCGQAFVQKCSLKGHIKTHHAEYNAAI